MMPSDPDKKMDELLRTYARKRREDAGEPPEMHPATRRLLQAEAAKLRPQEAKPQRIPWSWLFARWPRVAFAVGLFALLAVAVWNGIPHRGQTSSPSLVAKQDEKSKEVSQPQALERDALADSETQLRDGLEKDKDTSDRFRAVLKPEPARSLDEVQLRAENSPAKAGAQADTKRKQEPATLGMSLQPAPAPTDGFKRAEAEGAGGTFEKQPTARKLEVAATAPQVATGQPANLPLAATAPAPDANVTLKEASDSRAKQVGATYSAPATPTAAESYYRLPQVARADPLTNAVQLYDSPGGPGQSAGRATSLSRLPAPTAPAAPPTTTPASLASATQGNEAKARLDALTTEKRDGTAGVLQTDLAQTRARATSAASGPMLTAVDKTQLAPQSKKFYRYQREAESEKLVAAKPASQSAPASVLLNFEIEQDGDRVRVIDSDGSVYAGRFVTGAELGQARFAEIGEELNRAEPVGVAQRRQSNATEIARRYFTTAGSGVAITNRAFRVNGTNRTFGQLVTIEALLSGGPGGSFAGGARGASSTTRTAPPSVRPPAESPAKNRGAAPLGGAAADSEMLESQRLVGRLRVGASEEVKLIAVPAVK